MARQKISNRESAGTLTGAELVPIVRTSEALPADRNLQTTAQILSRLAYNRLIEDKDDNFDVDGASGTIYTDTGSGGTINANLQESAVGTTYTFCVTDNAIEVRDAVFSQTIRFWDAAQSASRNTSYVLLGSPGMSITITKISSTTWFATAVNGAIDND